MSSFVFFCFFFEDNCFTILCGFHHTSTWFRQILYQLSYYGSPESATGVHMYICPLPPERPFPSPSPFHLSCHRAQCWAPMSHSKFPLAIYFTYDKIYVSMPFSQFVPPSPSPSGPQVVSLCLHLHYCPAKRFISTINWYSHYGEQYGDSLKRKTRNRTTIWPNNPTTGHTPWEHHNWKRCMYPNDHCSTFYNSQDKEAT